MVKKKICAARPLKEAKGLLWYRFSMFFMPAAD